MLSQVTLQTSRNARRLVKAVQNRSGKMRERTPSYHQREKVTLHSGDATLKTETEYKDKISALTKKLVGADSLRRSRYEQLVAEHSEVISQLQRVICSSSSRLVPVGSIANSLCINNSDVDLCFVAENHDEFLRDFNENPNFKVALMRNVADLLEKSSELKLQYECVLLMRSRIPLVVVKLANGISVDIQFPSSNFHAVRNTNLIRHYVMADKRFPQLYMWARELFTALGARNSRQGLLSSYHIVLLVVHFLQCKHIFSEPVLPVLTQTHSHLVSRELPLSEIIKLMDRPITDELEGWSSANTMSVGTLAVKMIDYYTRFNIRTSMIDIANGRVVRRRQTPYNMKLQIMDPYSRITVCHSKDIVEAFYRAVTHTHEAFKSGSMIDSYPKFDDMAQAPQIRSGSYEFFK
ncbi:hypothetical protein QR680_006096 [Steinernema hermaphroditum]|uniref:Poly(A) RNA polymerase mitochondrial-like central palm domain-containing protein n=1 Tax=Steinernema hermaphroditum TaxID=289476 RepID=A0AA39LWT5_9BILA|nr:hypothetical protein QR680_006096 [Steinernema hermaphroditum]